MAQLNNTLNGVLSRVVGVLNAAELLVSPALVSALPPALQTLLSPVLVAPAGSSAPILDLVIASQDGTSPPVEVDLLGLHVTTSDINAQLSATTGDGMILGNLLYNVANLANPNFTVLGIQVMTNAQTQFNGPGGAQQFFTDAVGQAVKVKGTFTGGVVVADQVQIKH